MGLAEIKGEKCFDVFAEMLEPLLSIASDEEAMEYFKVQEVPEGEDAQAYALKRTKELLPLILKKHKDDIVAILAAFDGKTPAQYLKTLTVPGLFKSINDLVTDPVFRAFLS